jgi:hypothetical protein
MRKLLLILLAAVTVSLAGCFMPYVSADNVPPNAIPEAGAGMGWVLVPDYGWCYWTDNRWVYLQSAGWVYWPTFTVDVFHYYRARPYNQYHRYYGGHPMKRDFVPVQDWRKRHGAMRGSAQ